MYNKLYFLYMGGLSIQSCFFRNTRHGGPKPKCRNIPFRQHSKASLKPKHFFPFLLCLLSECGGRILSLRQGILALPKPLSRFLNFQKIMDFSAFSKMQSHFPLFPSFQKKILKNDLAFLTKPKN